MTDTSFPQSLAFVLKDEGIKRDLSYDPVTGLFVWNRDANNKQRLAGDVAGGIHGGYVRLKFKGQQIHAHRLAWWWVHGTWPSLEIDHINGNKSDNRFVNLRLATPVQQRANAKLNSNNTSGYRGVYYNKRRNKWRTHIQREHIGYFESKEEAARAYAAEFDARFGPEYRRAA